MKRINFPIPFRVIQKYKYLYFILTDIFMGVGIWLFMWLFNRLFSEPEPLFTTSSFLSLFIYLWFFYFCAFFMYEYAKKKHEKKSYSEDKHTKN